MERKARASARCYRVVQWATGNVGARALRRAIEHPRIRVVGVYVHSANKVGADAGSLAGIAPIGVAATNRIEDIIALRPDCVLYMPHVCNYDEVCRLLESGANVVTTRTEFLDPASMDPVIRARVEDACRRGHTSIHSTGSSPGFATEALPIVLLSIQRRLDYLSINEFADNGSRNSPAMLFEVMGFGKKPGSSYDGLRAHLREAFGPTLQLVARSVGMPLDGFEVRGDVGIARRDTAIAAGMVRAGTVAAMRTVVSGMRAGTALMSFTATWYVSPDVDTEGDEPWDFRPSGWRLLVRGDAPFDVTIGFPVVPEDFANMTPGLTAHRPINVIPYLCEAPPGIRTTIDLPQIIPELG
ncbi:MAG: dihydrodipicolinate reductase [Steroidobacteraceae bacterium]